MKMLFRLFFAAFFSTFCLHAFADWPLKLVRIACIPEARFFKIEYAAVNGDSALAEAKYEDAKRRKRLAAWRKHGFFDPSKLKYECKLPESVYQVTATQPEPSEQGMCGGAPSITLSVTKNGKKKLNQVIFGSDCFDRATVSSLTITDNLEGWGTGYEILCTYPNGGWPGSYSASKSDAEVCGFLDSVELINQNNIADFISENSK